MSSKSLVSIKSKVYCAKLNISGLILTVIDKENNRIIGVNGVFISGDNLKNARTNISSVDFIEAINVASQQYAVQKEYFEIVKNYLLHRLDQKNINVLINNIGNNQIAAVNEFQRIIKTALNIDIIDVYSEFDSISPAQYNEIIIAQKIDSLTLSQQVEIAAQYYDNNTQLAEESIKSSKQDIGITVIYFDAKQFSGVGFCFVNCITKKLLYCFCWVAEPAVVQSEVKANDALYDLFYKVTKAAERVTKLTPIQHEIQSSLWKIDINKLLHAIEHEASGLAGQLFASLLSQYKDIQVRAELHKIDVIRFHMLYNPSQFDKKTEEESSESKIDKKLVAVDVVLSPTSGKKVSQLQKGDFIYILIDTSTPYGYDVAKALNLIVDNKNTPIEAEVFSVNYSKKKGYTIFVKITESLYGKAIEEQDVKVKTKLVISDEEKASSKGSLLIGLIAGLIVIAILLFILLT
ncbi:MAG: hypothetical protein N3F66_01125 [Spirochaetes bacterium]|nr:hypothetical protein [Spirochaetota bacterium]